MGNAFVSKHIVRFSETDLAGVMHFSNYFRVMEDAEHEFWRSLGMSVVRPEGDVHISWPRKSVSFEDHRPMRFEDEIECRLSIEQISERAVTYFVAFMVEGECMAEGRTTMVCCHMENQSFRSCQIPQDIRAKFEAARG